METVAESPTCHIRSPQSSQDAFLRRWFDVTEPASLLQTNPNKKKIYRYPRSLGEVSHEGENKEAGEDVIPLDTDRKIRRLGLVLKSNTAALLLSASAPHGSLWRNICVGSLRNEPIQALTFPIKEFNWLILLEKQPPASQKVHMLNLFHVAALCSYDRSAAMIKDCSEGLGEVNSFTAAQKEIPSTWRIFLPSLIYLINIHIYGFGSWEGMCREIQGEKQELKWPKEIITSSSFREKKGKSTVEFLNWKRCWRGSFVIKEFCNMKTFILVGFLQENGCNSCTIFVKPLELKLKACTSTSLDGYKIYWCGVERQKQQKCLVTVQILWTSCIGFIPVL